MALFTSHPRLTVTVIETLLFCSSLISTQETSVIAIPEKPIGVTCISDNLKSMRCTVELATDLKTYSIPTQLRIEYATITNYLFDCPDWRLKQNTCYWPYKDSDFHQKFQPLVPEYKIIPIVKNNLGEVRGDIVIVKPKEIIKPGLVRRLTAHAINGISTCLNISCWRPNISFNINLEYRVGYRSKWEEFIKTFNNVTAEYPSFILCSLIPNTIYTVNISSKPEASRGDIYWSRTSETDSKTAAHVPGACPALSTDSYSEFTCKTGQVYHIIYWQTVPAIQENGPLFQYVVNISVIANGIRKSLDWEIYQPSFSSLRCGILPLKRNLSINSWLTPHSVLLLPKSADPDVEYTLEMKAFNVMGYSVNRTELTFIPPRAYDSKPMHVMVEYNSNNGSYLVTFRISNDSSNALSGVTYYWCQGQEIPSGYIECKSLYWKVMHNESRSMWILPVSTTDPDGQWYFAVSLQWDDGNSGMVWQTCFFPHYERVAYQDQTDKLNLDLGPDPRTSFTVVLSFDYCDQPNRPMFYQISYETQDTARSIEIRAEYGLNEIQVSNLEPDREYRINVSVVSKWETLITTQFYKWTNPIQDVFDDEDWFVATLIVVGVILLLLSLSCCFFKFWKKIKPPINKFFIPVMQSSMGDYMSVKSHSSDNIYTAEWVKNQQLHAIQEEDEDEVQSKQNRDSGTGTSLEGSNTDCRRHSSASQTDDKVPLAMTGTMGSVEAVRTQDYVSVDCQQPTSKYLLSSNSADEYMESYVVTTNCSRVRIHSSDSDTHNIANNDDIESVSVYSKMITPYKENSSLLQGKETDISLANNLHQNEEALTPENILIDIGYLKFTEFPTLNSNVGMAYDDQTGNHVNSQKSLLKTDTVLADYKSEPINQSLNDILDCVSRSSDFSTESDDEDEKQLYNYSRVCDPTNKNDESKNYVSDYVRCT